MRQIFRLSCFLSGLVLSINVAAAENESGESDEAALVAQNEAVEEGASAGASVEGAASASPSGEAEAEAEAGVAAEAGTPETTADVAEPSDEASAPVAAEAVAEEPEEVVEEEVDSKEDDGGVHLGDWQVVTNGYFRAPLAISLSKRPDPDDLDGGKHLQGVFGSNRLVDGGTQGYSSFGYTRLQEGEWAEVTITAKRKHVAASVAMMGYWYQFVGKGNEASSWFPGLGWVTLDTDFNLGSLKPNIELKAGAFLHVYGANGVYDTYLFSRTHLIGESLKLTLPFSDNFNLAITHGFGGNRNGVLDDDATAHTLAHYLTVAMNIAKILDIGLYYNYSWSNDPSHYEAGANAPDTYSEWRKAYMRTVGLDVKLNAPKAGNLWFAYSLIGIKNGWALSESIEVMHSAGGSGIASNYMGATGTGTMNNISWLYTNSLRNIMGQGMGSVFPDLTLTAFGLMAATKRDLEEGETIDEKLTQIKGGLDLTFWAKSWFGIMFRYDGVSLNTDQNGDGEDDGSSYHVLTPRVVFKSHFLSNESIWFQLSKYIYGDEFKDAGMWGAYNRPDELVFKLQCNMSW